MRPVDTRRRRALSGQDVGLLGLVSGKDSKETGNRGQGKGKGSQLCSCTEPSSNTVDHIYAPCYLCSQKEIKCYKNQ